MMINLPVSDMDKKLARAYISGSLDEEHLRESFVPADAAIIAAYQEIVADLRSEIDELTEDLKRAMGDLTVLERRLHHEQERGPDIASDIFEMATGMNRAIAEQYRGEK